MLSLSVPLSRCPVPTWTGSQDGQIHYVPVAAEASYDRERS